MYQIFGNFHGYVSEMTQHHLAVTLLIVRINTVV